MQTEGATFSYAGSTAQLTSEAQGLLSQIESLSGSFAVATDKSLAAKKAQDQLGISADGTGGAIDGLGADALGAAADLGTLQTETKKLSDLFTDFDKDVAAIRAKNELRGFLRDLSDELPKTNRNLFGTGEAAEKMQGTILDALEKAKADAVAYGEANGLTLAQVETRFQKNAENVRKTLVEEGFKKKDLEKFFGVDFVPLASVSVQGEMATAIGTMADRLGPIALREFKGVGLDLGNGIALGVSASSPQIDIETRRAITNAERAARDAAESKSPSKVFERIGNDLMAGLEKGIKDKSDKVAEKAKAAIEKGIGAVQNTIDTFTDYKDSIKSSIVGLLDLGAAYDSYTARQDAVTTTLAELMKYQAGVQGEATDDQKEKLLELQGAYQAAQTAAATGAQSIVDEFVNQGKQIQAFNDNLQTLLKAGLSKTAFDAIIAEGSDRGANIAAALVQGNVRENARRVSEVYTSVQAMGDQTGQMAASTFMGAGVKLAIEMLDGLIKEFLPAGKKRKALLDAIKGLNDSIKFDPKYIDIVTRRFDEGSSAPVYSPATSMDSFPVTPEDQALFSGLDSLDWSSIFPGFTAFAKGGIVTGPTLGLIGEAGPEAVIPLSKGGKIGGTTINLTVNAGMGTQGAEVGRQIVDALKAYERRNGSVYVAA
jgi:hypothetical protein